MSGPASQCVPWLAEQHCRNLPVGSPAMTPGEISEMLTALAGWKYDGNAIGKNFEFADYEKTMSFANAVAAIAQREDHHPEFSVSYSRCEVTYRTHSIGGISINDFICAAKIEALP